jgi:hypothetical protein
MAIMASSDNNDVVSTVHAFRDGGALTRSQAVLLLEAWPHLDDAWAASPYFGTVREHTRAYVNQLRRARAGTAKLAAEFSQAIPDEPLPLRYAYANAADGKESA